MRTKWIRVIMPMLIGAMFAVGCVQEQKKVAFAEDGDQQGTALGLFFDQPADDRLNAKFDKTDWRYVIVPESGTLSVNLFVDNPQMQGNLYLHDNLGRVWQTIPFSTTSAGSYQINGLKVEPGRYHLRVESLDGASVYTIGAGFEADPVEVAEVVEEEEEEEEEEVKEEPKKKKKKKRKKRKKKKKKKKEEKKEDSDTKTGTKYEYEGTISLVTEKADGSISVTITGVGKEELLSGERGKTESGKKVKITRCTRSRCYGEIKDATANDVRKNSSIKFVVYR